MHSVVFLDRASIIAQLRAPRFVHRWSDYDQTADADVLTRLADADIAIVNKVPLRGETLSQLAKLKLVAVCATGTNNVDLDYCRAHAIAVTNIRDYAAHTVPEHVFMSLLALRRNLFAYRTALNDGAWQRAAQFCLFDPPIHDLHGSAMAIIGYGGLGRAVAQLACAFGMRVLIAEHKGATNVRPGYTTFDDAIARADVISVHAPLTEQTRNLIGAAEFARMKSNAILIQYARGGIVDEEALIDALRTQRIAGAAVDVLTVEPPREGHPLLDARLPNLIVTPHNAWASREAMQGMADQLVDVLEAFVAGAPRNRVV